MTTPLFFHGREGSNQGRKARWLTREYGACTPSYPTGTVEEAMPLARQVLKEHRPTVIVGSSFGGAVLLRLIQEGLWEGPSVFLAQAGVKFGLPVELPAHVPAILIHGTQDDVVDFDESRRLAQSVSAQLVSVEDDHRLGSILQNGVLEQALHSLGIEPLLSKPLPSGMREDTLTWFAEFVDKDTPLERRKTLLEGRRHCDEDIRRAMVAVLRGLWRTPASDAEVKNRLCLFEVASSRCGGFDQAPYGLEVRAVDQHNELHIGKIKTTYGTSLYNFHYEWPIEGAGVRKDLIEVFPPEGGKPEPILEWLRKQNRVIFCYHCGGIVSDRVEHVHCPGRGV